MTRSISQTLRDLGRPVAYYPSIALALDDLKGAIFACQFLYWEGKQADPSGWIYKTGKQITEETGLSRYEQESLRKRLIHLGVLEERLQGMPATMAFKFNWEVLDDLFEARESEIKEPRPIKKFQTMEDLLTHLLQEERWVEAAMMQLKFKNNDQSRKAFKEYLRTFLIEAGSKNKLDQPVSDLQAYFINWSKFNPPPPTAGGKELII